MWVTGQNVGGIERRIDENITPYVQRLDLQSPLYIGVDDLSTTKRLMVPSGAEVGIGKFTVNHLVDNYGVVRVYDEITVKSGGVLIIRDGSTLVLIKG